jgi:hypothetical protein
LDKGNHPMPLRSEGLRHLSLICALNWEEMICAATCHGRGIAADMVKGPTRLLCRSLQWHCACHLSNFGPTGRSRCGKLHLGSMILQLMYIYFLGKILELIICAALQS